MTTRTIDEEQERIVQRAYEIYLARGGMDGISEDDWLRAVTELRAETAGRLPAAAVSPH